MQPSFSIQNKIAIVTGASKGIGYGLAKSLAAAGAIVAVMARSRVSLDQLVEEITEAGGQAKAYELDVRDVKQIGNVFGQVAEDFGRLDIVVNNAGLGEGMPAADVTEEYWDEMMDVNLKGVFFCCQAAGRIMLEQGSGKIINVSSQVSIVGIADGVAYCASKGGMNQLTKVLALEWSGRGVCINAVGPTFIYTPGTAERLDTPEFRDEVLARIPAGRIGTIEDVAGAVIYLASPASDLVTGTLLLVDGGWTAQ
ncbi:short-chain dehydrogenase [Paenibacillus sp. J23TS9]|uniref:SDR family NAD(P)-dependent oxidoreductase n=1 Tax=Paenibacillus sp. J23TS9 TaxID=2807193 RepID=UPI001B249E6A|nr:glucose 1-dehydrogenase [Paenibacillus sp. J23TS9]GIP26999.1 short-chain dehydrogenase [Paenibacillus sp. J23TS9]